MKRLTTAVLILTIFMTACLIGCGKSNKQIEAEAAKVRTDEAKNQEAQQQLERQKAESDEKQLAEEQRKVDTIQTTRLKLLTTQPMKDPSSVQFQNTKLNTAKTALCGQINAKNSFGGYVGFRDFITTEMEVFIKPEACGTDSASRMPLSEMPACVAYLKATNIENKCD